MSLTYSVSVHVEPPYPVEIGSGLLHQCGDRLAKLIGPCRIAVISDTNVAPLYLQTVLDSLRGAGFSVCSYVFPAGETHKTLETLGGILEFLAQEQLTRTDCVAALGGGVCGDMAGFAAGCYLRGIRCVQLPTSLLASVDSSVGGKTAVDLSAGKNLAGLFLQPSAVLCDIDCLSTLPSEFVTDGMGEVVKTGVLTGESLLQLCTTQGHLPAQPAQLIAQCVQYKASVVEQDARETDLRRLLNLGHTMAHAIERCSHYGISHGHAVAIGLARIAQASRKLGWSTPDCTRRILQVLEQNRLPTTTSFSAKELAEAALSDKKRTGDTITLVIPKQIGHCVLRPIPVTQLESVFQAGLED